MSLARVGAVAARHVSRPAAHWGGPVEKRVALGGLSAQKQKIAPAVQKQLDALENVLGVSEAGLVFARAYRFEKPAELAKAMKSQARAKDVLYMGVEGRYADPHNDATDPDIARDFKVVAAKPSDIAPYLVKELGAYAEGPVDPKLPELQDRAKRLAGQLLEPGAKLYRVQWDPQAGWENMYDAFVSVNAKSGVVRMLAVGSEG